MGMGIGSCRQVSSGWQEREIKLNDDDAGGSSSMHQRSAPRFPAVSELLKQALKDSVLAKVLREQAHLMHGLRALNLTEALPFIRLIHGI